MRRWILWGMLGVGACGTPSADADKPVVTDPATETDEPTTDEPGTDVTEPPAPDAPMGDAVGVTQGAAVLETSRYRLEVGVGGAAAGARSTNRHALNVGVAAPSPAP